jgi:hypothetical protein
MVISMIFILIALSLGSLMKAKGKSTEISCLSNERNFSQGIYLFATEHESLIKPSFENTAVFDIDYVYEDYVDNPGIMRCPAESPDAGIFLAFKNRVIRGNYAVFSPFNYAAAYSLEDKEYKPSTVRMIGEAIPSISGYYWFDSTLCPWNTAARWRHSNNKRMNIIYADGSGGSERIIASPFPDTPEIPPYINSNR